VLSEEVTVTVHPSDEAEVRAIVPRILSLWAEVTSGRASAEAIAAVYTDDADFIVGDGTHLHGRDEIAAYFEKMVAGADAHGTTIRGTTVTAEIESVRFLGDQVALLLLQGGILLPGETTVPPERRGIQSGVAVKQDGAWLVTAYQNTRIHPQS
jgi:uncharacterized protein (TIGR02246 family)